MQNTEEMKVITNIDDVPEEMLAELSDGLGDDDDEEG